MSAPGYVARLRNRQMDAITTDAGSGAKFVLMSGTRPATGGAETTRLVTFTMGTPFASASVNGVLTVTLPADVTASVTGVATWARLFQADGTTIVADYSVAVSGEAVTINSTSITAGVTCSITSFGVICGNA